MRASSAPTEPACARKAGNREAWQRLTEAEPVVRDVRPTGAGHHVPICPRSGRSATGVIDAPMEYFEHAVGLLGG